MRFSNFVFFPSHYLYFSRILNGRKLLTATICFVVYRTNVLNLIPMWTISKSLHVEAKELTVIDLFCLCCMPECYYNMTECDLCLEWFHTGCVQLNEERQGEWLCKVCRPSTKRLCKMLEIQNINGLALQIFTIYRCRLLVVSFQLVIFYSIVIVKVSKFLKFTVVS